MPEAETLRSFMERESGMTALDREAYLARFQREDPQSVFLAQVVGQIGEDRVIERFCLVGNTPREEDDLKALIRRHFNGHRMSTIEFRSGPTAIIRVIDSEKEVEYAVALTPQPIPASPSTDWAVSVVRPL